MFAYCGNNPVICIDNSGMDFIWQRLFEDSHFGFIHLAVQLHIISCHPELNMEQYVYNSDKNVCGRADVFNLNNGEIWEIKTTRTGAEAAETQVSKYCQEGNYLHDCDIILTKGASNIGGNFTLLCMGDYYTVTYFSPEPGVILYKAEKSKPEAHPYAIYVPTPQQTKERRSMIGDIPVYIMGSVVCGLVVTKLMRTCSGSGGFAELKE